MSGKVWVIAASISGLILLGLITLKAQAIILALPLLVYLAAAIFYAPDEIKLTATRKLSTENVQQGSVVNIHLTISNKGVGLEEAFLEDILPHMLDLVKGEHRQVTAFRSKGTTVLDYDVRGKRGRYRFQGVMVRASDFSGLFQIQSFIRAPIDLLVFPDQLSIKRIPIRPQQTRGFSGPIPIRKGGSGMDFHGVREYQLGDPVRHVNWRISARQPEELFTNEFELERIADVGLILDARQEIDLHIGGQRLFDYSVLAAAALSNTFLNAGHRVGLFVYGYSLERVFPGYGKIQQKRILATLARAETGFNYALQSLNNIPTRLFPAKSQLVLVSPLGQSDLAPLYRLRSMGYEILIISPDPIDFEKRGIAQEPVLEPAIQLAYIERKILLNKLRHAGIQVVDWKVEIPLERAIGPALSQQTLFRRNIRMIP